MSRSMCSKPRRKGLLSCIRFISKPSFQRLCRSPYGRPFEVKTAPGGRRFTENVGIFWNDSRNHAGPWEGDAFSKSAGEDSGPGTDQHIERHGEDDRGKDVIEDTLV